MENLSKNPEFLEIFSREFEKYIQPEVSEYKRRMEAAKNVRSKQSVFKKITQKILNPWKRMK